MFKTTEKYIPDGRLEELKKHDAICSGLWVHQSKTASRTASSHLTKEAFVLSLIPPKAPFPQVITAYLSWNYASPNYSRPALLQRHEGGSELDPGSYWLKMQ